MIFNPATSSPGITAKLIFPCLIALGALTGASSLIASQPESQPRLLDLSGLAWIGGDRFLAVSDAKNPREDDLNRVSVLTLPDSLDGMGFESAKLRYSGGPSSDLESAARIPGRSIVLLVESADDNSPFQRLFLARVGHPRPRIVDMTEWSTFTEVFNVEATAVAATDAGFKFIWAERNSGEQSTEIKWATLTLAPLVIGPQEGSVEFTLPDYLVNENEKPLFSRAIVGLDIDSAGNIYSVASFDPEDMVEDPDNGPFRSAVLRIGQVNANGVVLDDSPDVLAMADGLKIESVAIRETDEGIEIFVGTDDENFGGILREIPPLDLP